VVMSERRSHKACYEKLLDRSPSAEGTVTLRFTVTADGAVADPSFETADATLRDPDLERCLLGVVEKLVFPASGTKGTIAYPLRLTPGDKR
jgi:outer membrane biosynthesis protein TonB